METPLHRVAIQYIVERGERHSLVMRHVGVNHYAGPAIRFTLAGEINGLIKAHGSAEAEGL